MIKKNFLFIILFFIFSLVLCSSLVQSEDLSSYQEKKVSFNFSKDYNVRTIFLPIGIDENLIIDNNSSLSATTEIRLYSLTSKELLEGLLHQDYKISTESTDYSKFKLIHWTTIKELERTNFTIPLSDFGAWCVVAKQNNIEQSAFIVRSPIASMVKNGKDGLILWSQDLATGNKKFAGKATVYSLNNSVNRLDEINFSDDKIANLPYKDNADLVLIETEFGWNIIPLNLKDLTFSSYRHYGEYFIYSPTQKRYVFTDKPLYQAGDTVYFKILSREDDDGRYQISQKNFKVQIHSGWGDDKNILFEQNYNPDEFGAVADSFALPKNIEFGDYKVSVENANFVSFEVQEYIKPEYTLKINSDQTEAVAGEVLEAEISGTSYAGWPMANMTFDYCFDERYYYHDCASWSQMQFDQFGKTKITIPSNVSTNLTSNTKTYFNFSKTLNVRYSDGASEPATDYKDFSIRYTPFEFVWPENLNYLWKKNTNQHLTGKIVSINQASVFNKKIELTVYYTHDSNDIFFAEDNQSTMVTYTDKQGNFVFDYFSEELGSYRLVYIIFSNNGFFTQDIHYRRVVIDSPEKTEEKVNKLSVFIDEKRKYLPEEQLVANYKINNILSDRDYFVNFGRQRVDRYSVENFDSISTNRSYAITKDDLPNTYLDISLFERNNYISQSSPVTMEKDLKKINLTIETNKQTYEPGEKVTVKIKALNEKTGQPVVANVTLWTTDQALYALSSSTRDNIFQYYWYDRYHGISTHHSLQAISIWGAEGGGGGSGDYRSIFKDTAYWNPNIITNEKGEAIIDFVLPDNLTTWVLNSIAASKDTQVGEKTTQIKVQKNIVVRALTPELMRVGDILQLGIIATNYTDKPETFKAIWETSNDLKNLQSLPEPFVLQANETKTLTWKVEATKANLQVPIKVGIENLFHPELSDYLVKKIEILPYGYPQNDSSFSLQPKSFTLPIEKDAELAKSTLSVSLATNVLGSLKTAMQSLVTYPYGCVEQTTSRLIPVLMARSHAIFAQQAFGKDLNELTNTGIKNLIKMQNNDGSWGFWNKGNDGHAFKTAYVVKYLLLANNEKTPVKDEVFSSAGRYFRKNLDTYDSIPQQSQLTDVKQSELVSSFYGLLLIDQAYPELKVWQLDAYVPKKDANYYQQLLATIQINDADLLAWLVQINILMQNQIGAEKHLQQLLTTEKDTTEIKSSTENSTRYRTLQSDSAFALQAVTKFYQTYNQHELEMLNLVTKLLNYRQRNDWHNTFATAQAVEALSSWSSVQPEKLNTGHYQLSIGNQILSEFNFAKSNVAEKSFVFKLSEFDINDKQLTVSRLDENKNNPIFITVNLNQWRISTQGATENKSLKIYKAFVREQPSQNTNLLPGEIVTVYLGIENLGNCSTNYVNIDDYLPSNMRPLFSNNNDYANSTFSFTGFNRTLYSLYRGKKIISYRAIVTNQAEKISIPPTTVSAMYDPNFNIQTNMTTDLEVLSSKPDWARVVETKKSSFEDNMSKQSIQQKKLPQSDRKISMEQIINYIIIILGLLIIVLLVAYCFFLRKIKVIWTKIKIVYISWWRKIRDNVKFPQKP